MEMKEIEKQALASLMARKLEVRIGSADDGRQVVQDALGNAPGWETTLKSITNTIHGALERGEETDHCYIGALIDGAVRDYAKTLISAAKIEQEAEELARARREEDALETAMGRADWHRDRARDMALEARS
jgi:hypothetical protein